MPELKDAGWGTWSKHLAAIRNGSWDGLDWVCGEVEEQYDMGAKRAAEKEADVSYARNFPLHVAVTENNLPVIRWATSAVLSTAAAAPPWLQL